MAELKWFIKSFKDLNSDEFFDMYYLRQEVFVVEQNCPYQDCDEKDKNSYHLLAYDGDILVAYLRIVEPGYSYFEASIGRVVTKLEYRGKGIGNILMTKGIESVQSLYHTPTVRISAQQYLIPFYTSLKFETVGESYLEDDIPHIEMVYREV
tara:strand:- start:180 stop:635 length:456 start_codon:yes stop_codon:yes gene_type:complete